MCPLAEGEAISLLYFRLKWREADSLDFDQQFAWARSWKWGCINHQVGILLFDPSCLIAHFGLGIFCRIFMNDVSVLRQLKQSFGQGRETNLIESQMVRCK
jgi:hypothetical protein